MGILGLNDRATAQGIRVFRATDFTVCNGANLGDPIAEARELMLDDLYQLTPEARKWRLRLAAVDGGAHMVVREGSQLGAPDSDVHLDCCVTLMAPNGATVDALLLVELEPKRGTIAQTYLMPLDDLRPRVEYALVNIDETNPRARFAELACVSFTRGTRITMASGEQRPIEDIGVGDKVLTRDNGIQPVRWVGQQTTRATGAFAPIVITKGALNNAQDLQLSPNQRLFVYQREDRLNAGQSEVVVKAELLVNGDNIRRSDGGFVDYFQILFDNHEFIFAEGIAAESLTVDQRTSPALPPHVQDRLGFSKLSRNRSRPVELGEGALDGAITADIVRRAATL